MPLPFLILSQSDYLIQIVDINSYTEWQTVQIQSEANWSGSTLFAKAEPRGFSRTWVIAKAEPRRFSRTRVKALPLLQVIFVCSGYRSHVIVSCHGLFLKISSFGKALSPNCGLSWLVEWGGGGGRWGGGWGSGGVPSYKCTVRMFVPNGPIFSVLQSI